MSMREGMAVRGLGRAAVVAALIALLIAGCTAIDRDRRTVSLDSTVRAYLAALRWGDFEGMLAFLPPDTRPEQVPAMFSDLRVTRFEVVRPVVMLTDTQASQTVAIEYLYEYNQIVRRIIDRQSWRWDDEAQAWWLESGLPEF